MAVSGGPGLRPAFALLLLCSGCGMAKYQLSDGRYRTNEGVVDLQMTNDTVTILDGGFQGRSTVYPPMVAGPVPEPVVLDQTSFDVDLLSILLKYRPAQGTSQPQLQSQLGGGLFIDRRVDRHILSYPQSAFPRSERRMRHYGLSVGGIIGLGATPVNPWVTDGAVSVEYDGVVFSYGVAVIAAVDRFTQGAALGWDLLLNDDAEHWVFQRKPWLGPVLGLNLN